MLCSPPLVALLSIARAATLEVPADHPTLQAAVDAASAGDTIVLAGGTFRGDVTITKDLAVVGAGMNRSVIQDGSGQDGVSIDGATVVMENLSVRATTTATALETLGGADVTLVSVKLRGGSSDGYYDYYGGGLQVQDGSTVTMERSIVCSGNGAADYMFGGGVVVRPGTTFVANHSVFFDNDAFVGGAIQSEGDTVLINNTFYDNVAEFGAAVEVEAGLTTMVNNIVLDNSSPAYSGYPIQYVVWSFYVSPGFAGGHNLYQGNTTGTTNEPLPGDLTGAPLLANPTVSCEDATLADFLPQPGSAALGAGDPAFGDDIGALPDDDRDGSPATADCDDDDATVFPGAEEIVGDGIDQDCDGLESCYVDADVDSARSSQIEVSADLDCDAAGLALADAPIDCDDDDADVNPDADEIVADGVDQDCNGTETCYLDSDNDGYGDPVLTTEDPLLCLGIRASDDPSDCDDTDPNRSPAAPEQCNGIDDDCDEVVDDDVVSLPWYPDTDEDGYGDPGGPVVEDCLAPPGHVSNALDCDDRSAAINPGVPELPCDGIDNDCDPATPDDLGCGPGGTADTGLPPSDTAAPTGTDPDTGGAPSLTDTAPPTNPLDPTTEAPPAPTAAAGCSCGQALSPTGLLALLAPLAVARRRRRA